MPESLQRIIEAIPFALIFGAALTSIAYAFSEFVLKKRMHVVYAAIITFYLGFIIYITIISRLDGLGTLFRWYWPDGFIAGTRLDIHDDNTLRDGLFNTLVFIPWGFIFMARVKHPLQSIIVFIAGLVAVFLIELYWLGSAGMFDMGYSALRLLGVIISTAIMIPIAHLRRNHVLRVEGVSGDTVKVV